MTKEPNNNNNYRDDELYDVPYTRAEQNKMTEACFLEILQVVKLIIRKHEQMITVMCAIDKEIKP